MNKQEKIRDAAKKLYKLMFSVFVVFAILAFFLLYLMVDPKLSAFKSNTDSVYTEVIAEQTQLSDEDYDKIENGVHIRTGFVDGDGLMTVVNNCTNCHSAKLVTQNRMSKERWRATIRWMQETQNLWDLGSNEEIIVNYLAKNYPETQKGRRQNLTDVQWYELKN